MSTSNIKPEEAGQVYATLRTLGAISGVETDSNKLCAVFPVFSFSDTGYPAYHLARHSTLNRSILMSESQASIRPQFWGKGNLGEAKNTFGAAACVTMYILQSDSC